MDKLYGYQVRVSTRGGGHTVLASLRRDDYCTIPRPLMAEGETGPRHAARRVIRRVVEPSRCHRCSGVVDSPTSERQAENRPGGCTVGRQ
jgi:hypothetical protein